MDEKVFLKIVEIAENMEKVVPIDIKESRKKLTEELADCYKDDDYTYEENFEYQKYREFEMDVHDRECLLYDIRNWLSNTPIKENVEIIMDAIQDYMNIVEDKGISSEDLNALRKTLTSIFRNK